MLYLCISWHYVEILTNALVDSVVSVNLRDDSVNNCSSKRFSESLKINKSCNLQCQLKNISCHLSDTIGVLASALTLKEPWLIEVLTYVHTFQVFKVGLSLLLNGVP